MTQADDKALIAILTKAVDSIAQRVHLFTGALYVVLIMYYRQPQIIWYAVLLYGAFWAWKEFSWDEKHEIPQIRGSSAKDFFFYLIGLMIGGAVVWLHYLIFKSVI